jgi:PIN domain nuclease of toxin-antitoxin system
MILLDTPVVPWRTCDPVRLSPTAKAAREESRKNEYGLAICGTTLLELAMLATQRRIDLAIRPRSGRLNARLQNSRRFRSRRTVRRVAGGRR